MIMARIRLIGWGAAAGCVLWLCGAPTSGAFAGEAGAAAYARIVASEPELVAFWPLDGNLRPAKGTIAVEPKGGEPRFGPGPKDGKALVLEGGRYVTMGSTPELDLQQTTVELWFRPDFNPGPGYNPCIIAKRADGDHTFTRFSLHILGDYSRLAVWNGKAVMEYGVGDGPLVRGRWYHLALTCTQEKMQLYVDGVAAERTNLPGLFSFERSGLPLSIGSSQPRGAELLAGSVASVAVYRRALTAAAIAAHVDAMGFRAERLQLVELQKTRAEREKKRRAELDAQREQRRAELTSDPALLARGKPTIYRGDYLGAIRLTLGGIGTGSIQINGRGQREIWQIFNNYAQVTVPHSFFAARVKMPDRPPVVRALQTVPVGPLAAMRELSFRGEYPFGWYAFEDPGVPVKLSMETFNPLVPLDAKNSSIPCVIFNLTAENPTDRPADVAFLATQQNAVGYLGIAPIQDRAYSGYGENKNKIVRDPKATILSMTSGKAKSTPAWGDMALVAMSPNASGSAAWDTLESLAVEFSSTGRLSGPEAAGPSPPAQTLDGALAVSLTLQPGEKRAVPFVLTWYFPNVKHGIDQWHCQGNMYANHWPSALAVARDLEGRLGELTEKTRCFHDAFYASNLPHWLLDRITSQVAILRSQTCFWGKDGYFGGWEGCNLDSGCCHGNCNHVWHYAQAHARLFPEIARQMRAQEFRFQTPNGAIPHRQFKEFPACDGQCGAVLNSYREHLLSPDRKWLDANWPGIKRAMEYVIVTWDKNQDGVLAGPQWNTLDGALGGNTSWLGTMYLAALAAAEKMALLENDPQAAKRYAAIRASGSKLQDQTLFNGEYYIQIPDPEPREDYGTGCEIDQLLGQWWAHQLDLGWLYPPDRARTALRSLFKYNFRGNMLGLVQVPRKFVADEDPAMQMITWPKGPRPAKCILYGDEAMTGFEYAAAAAMVQAGLVREGLTVARGVWARYDGRLRQGVAVGGFNGNPFGDDECGKYYARAMSVWSLLLACQGFVYDGPAGTIGFRPVWQPEDHVSFFTAAEGWGVFTQRVGCSASTRGASVGASKEGAQRAPYLTSQIDLCWGRLRVGTLVFQVPEGARPTAVEVHHGGQPVAATFVLDARDVRVSLAQPVNVGPGASLAVAITLPYSATR
jgi:uncharacterized protein (DUF608 family)